MKKSLLILSLFLMVLALIFLYAKSHVEDILVHFIRVLTGLSVRPTDLKIEFKPWILRVEMRDTKISGFINGNVNKASIVINWKKGYFPQEVTISEFNFFLGGDKKWDRQISLPSIEFFEAKDGVFFFEGNEITIHRLELSSFIRGKTFTLFARIANEPVFSAGTLTLKGRYGEILEEISGTYEIENLELNSFSSWIKGKTDLTGDITLKRSKLITEGKFKTRNVSVTGEIFKEPYLFVQATGNYRISQFLKKTTLTLTLHNSDGIIMDFIFDFREKDLRGLKLKSSEIEIRKIKRHINLLKFIETDPWKYIPHGSVVISELTYGRGLPFEAKLQLLKACLSVEKFHFQNVEGELKLTDKEIVINHASGNYKDSRFERLKGKIEFSGAVEGTIQGVFQANLSDVSNFVNVDRVTISSGFATGIFVITFDANGNIRYEIEGDLKSGKGLFENNIFGFEGKIRGSNEVVFFDPLILTHENSLVQIEGSKREPNQWDLKVKGKVQADTVRSFKRIPIDINGESLVDFSLHTHKEGWKINGVFDLTGMSIIYHNFFKKDRGVKSLVRLNLEKKGNSIDVSDLFVTLKELILKGSGKADPNGIMDCYFSVQIENLKEIAPCFYFEDISESGKLKAEVTIKDFKFSLQELPYVKGYVDIRNGFFRIPNMIAPIRNLNLRADFDGERMRIKVDGLRLGDTVLKWADLTVEDVAYPTLTGFAAFRNINISDFRWSEKRKISIPILKGGDLLWKTKISLRISANTGIGKEVPFENLLLDVSKRGSELFIIINSLSILGAQADAKTKLNFSGPKPRCEFDIRLSGVDLKQISYVMKKAYLIEGKANMAAKLSSEGGDIEEMFKNVEGHIYFLSKKGVIKKWNMIARVLELLNIYQIIRLKLDLNKEGLVYNRMGGSFFLSQGKLRTEDFVIDSPSMIIQAKGTIETRTQKVRGNIFVAPLVAIEKTLDKIPLLRNILKGKGKGFLTVEYSVNGNISDPEIVIDMVRTVPGKIFDILRNIILLPRDILELDK
ncbi:MAG: AsmA-like C-terminal region-containing protein [Deltaproteobacteria bacterium]|nr:AsmA-like C-terminal region-containing protein [Deltaproteobacteria bacterium]